MILPCVIVTQMVKWKIEVAINSVIDNKYLMKLTHIPLLSLVGFHKAYQYIILHLHVVFYLNPYNRSLT